MYYIAYCVDGGTWEADNLSDMAYDIAERSAYNDDATPELQRLSFMDEQKQEHDLSQDKLTELQKRIETCNKHLLEAYQEAEEDMKMMQSDYYADVA
jgi:hypothetical protein